VPIARALDPETAEWLDGPRFTDWLLENGLNSPAVQLDSRLERAFGRWRAGAKASVWIADAMLVALGLHLSELPDDLWVEEPNGGAGRLTEWAKAEILGRLHASEPVRQIAHQLGCSPGTVRHYRNTRLQQEAA